MSKTSNSSEESALRRMRRKAGLTQGELAQLAGVTAQTVWRLENDKDFNPRLQTLRALARALRVSVASLTNTRS